MSPRADCRAFLFSVPALFLAACVTVFTGEYRSMTAGVIGCPADEVTITDERNIVWGGQGMDWRAECRGHRFICSYSGSTACKEELQPARSGAQSTAGCAPETGADKVTSAGTSSPEGRTSK
jgi:hypothetical protein